MKAETEPDNLASQRVLAETGFIPNGIIGEKDARFEIGKKGCLAKFVCHTATIGNVKKIFACGILLSTRKVFHKIGEELVCELLK